MEDGYMQIRDRSKDIIISGGENISSIEVENALYCHPAISAAAVVAMPDERWGEVPCAFVELKEGEITDEEAVIAHCRSLLASYKIPKAVRFGNLPKTSTGKIQKFELRARVKSTSVIETLSITQNPQSTKS
jgi:fatty-acyl-CoA synthase